LEKSVLASVDEDLLMILDMYLGDIVTEVIRRHGYQVVLEEEYYDLLFFIYKEICRAWFGEKTPSLRELRERLIRARRKRTELEVLVSYLVSKYLERSDTLYVEQ